jgi:hypothetical protein
MKAGKTVISAGAPRRAAVESVDAMSDEETRSRLRILACRVEPKPYEVSMICHERWLAELSRVLDADLILTCAAAPVQVHGHVNGHPLFFRSRWGDWRCEIGEWVVEIGAEGAPEIIDELYMAGELETMLTWCITKWRETQI